MYRVCLLWIAVAAACARPSTREPISSRTTDRTAPASAPLPIEGKERVPFDSNDARITVTARAVLDQVVRRLRAEPDLSLQISGHTDPSETDAANTSDSGLAHRRALAVQDHLIANGIAEKRLLLRAVGTAEPLGSNATDAGRATNRRVQFEQVTIRVDPISGRVVVTDSDVEILDTITFAPGSVRIEPSSFPILDAVAATLHGNPSIKRVEVQSHTDERGDDAANLRLTQARAKVVVAYLVAKGIDPARLDPQGYGETQPIDNRHDEAAWAKNRRIAFLILERAP